MIMRLSTRLTLFFLATLAVVLAGFSVTLYVLAAKYLHRQADERLEAALNTLVAAAEIGPEGVEWEPDERSLTFGRRTIEGQFSWRVGDDRGQRLDGSSADEMDRILAGPSAGRWNRAPCSIERGPIGNAVAGLDPPARLATGQPRRTER